VSHHAACPRPCHRPQGCATCPAQRRALHVLSDALAGTGNSIGGVTRLSRVELEDRRCGGLARRLSRRVRASCLSRRAPPLHVLLKIFPPVRNRAQLVFYSQRRFAPVANPFPQPLRTRRTDSRVCANRHSLTDARGIKQVKSPFQPRRSLSPSTGGGSNP